MPVEPHVAWHALSRTQPAPRRVLWPVLGLPWRGRWVLGRVETLGQQARGTEDRPGVRMGLTFMSRWFSCPLALNPKLADR